MRNRMQTGWLVQTASLYWVYHVLEEYGGLVLDPAVLVTRGLLIPALSSTDNSTAVVRPGPGPALLAAPPHAPLPARVLAAAETGTQQDFSQVRRDEGEVSSL